MRSGKGHTHTHMYIYREQSWLFEYVVERRNFKLLFSARGNYFGR